MRAAAVCFLLVLSCAAPKRDYSAGQIAAETDFKKLMDVNATVADPRFKLARGLDPEKMSGDDFEQFFDMGTRLTLTSKRISEIATSDFGGFNAQLGSRAQALARYAKEKDGANTLKTVRLIQKTCAACHAEFR